jgi:predicted metalloprotease
MRWTGSRESGNIEDRRGMGGLAAGGGIGAVVIALVVMLLGGDPNDVLPPAGGGTGSTSPGASPAADDSAMRFVRHVLTDTEDTWSRIFQEKYHQDYPEPTLTLFTAATQSGCGFAQSGMGPFYCPVDHKVYIDLGFYDQLRDQLGAPGDFAQAYVIAHEVGHHVQTVTGITERVEQVNQRSSEEERNATSVRVELQADCYAGVWAYHASHSGNWEMDPGDFEEGMRAAGAIGDDKLQQDAQGSVQPETFTHGTSEQRMHWLRRGMESGDPDACNTFDAPNL